MFRNTCAATAVAALMTVAITSIGANAADAASSRPTASAELTASATCTLSAVVQWNNFPESVTLVAAQLTSRGGGRPTQLEDQNTASVSGTSGSVTIQFNWVATPGNTYYVDAQVNGPSAHATAKSRGISVSCTPV